MKIAGWGQATPSPHKPKFLYNKDLRLLKMEAGGFEPPSRDASGQASTCVVALLFFRLIKRQTTGF